MATITSVRMSIATGPAPGSVVVNVHGVLDLASAASLPRVLDAIVNDRDILAIRVDLHDVRGLDIGGISGLAGAADRVALRGVELTLSDPSELLCEALELEGLTGLVRMGIHDRQTLWSSDESDRLQEWGRHRAGHPARA